ncbi:MAG TPA: hypothetical protein VER11_34425 [Polyangiaceae bacterium]|nr:hypothetical protein [Polyangiaceae bacterium]
MPIEQILTDVTSALGAIGVISAVLAHLPLPAKYAQFFARLASYAANAKFSVNVRETPKPKGDEPKLPPMFPGAGAAVLLLAASLHASACSNPKPPCDEARLAGVVASCVVKSQQCANAGKSEAECETLADCDTAIEKACGQ